MNDAFVETQAEALAARVSIAEETAAGRLKLAYKLLFGRAPKVNETQMAMRYLHAYKSEVNAPELESDGKTRSAWTGLMRVLLSSNEFFYVD